ALRVRILERAVQRLDHLLGRGLALRRDDAIELDQRGVLAARAGNAVLVRLADPAEPARDDQQCQREPHQAEERLPLARTALLVQRAQGELLEHGAFPLRWAWIRHGVPISLCGLSARITWPSSSRSASRASDAPRH